MRNFPQRGCISENYCTPFCAENAPLLEILLKLGLYAERGTPNTGYNVYHFARAVFYQNFMLMRKIDALSDRIRTLEEKANQ